MVTRGVRARVATLVTIGLVVGSLSGCASSPMPTSLTWDELVGDYVTDEPRLDAQATLTLGLDGSLVAEGLPDNAFQNEEPRGGEFRVTGTCNTEVRDATGSGSWNVSWVLDEQAGFHPRSTTQVWFWWTGSDWQLSIRAGADPDAPNGWLYFNPVGENSPYPNGLRERSVEGSP